MINKVIEEMDKFSEKGLTNEYVGYLKRSMIPIMDYCKLPELYSCAFLDETKIISKFTKMLSSRIKPLINSKTNMYIIVDPKSSFSIGGYITSTLIKDYFVDIFKTEYTQTNMTEYEQKSNILYIDTPLLLKSYKNRIAQSNGEQDIDKFSYYDTDVLYNTIVNIDYVFWDKFDKLESDYDFQKVTEIMQLRCYRRLGNCFISSKSFDKFKTILATNCNELVEYMQIYNKEQIVDLSGIHMSTNNMDNRVEMLEYER